MKYKLTLSEKITASVKRQEHKQKHHPLRPVYTKGLWFPCGLASHLHENPFFYHRKQLFLKTPAKVEISENTGCRVSWEK